MEKTGPGGGRAAGGKALHGQPGGREGGKGRGKAFGKEKARRRLGRGGRAAAPGAERGGGRLAARPPHFSILLKRERRPRRSFDEGRPSPDPSEKSRSAAPGAACRPTGFAERRFLRGDLSAESPCRAVLSLSREPAFAAPPPSCRAALLLPGRLALTGPPCPYRAALPCRTPSNPPCRHCALRARLSPAPLSGSASASLPAGPGSSARLSPASPLSQRGRQASRRCSSSTRKCFFS